MYRVLFSDSVHGTFWEEFEDFDSAAEYWQSYTDTPTCIAGRLVDLDNGEIIWQFGEEGNR